MRALTNHPLPFLLMPGLPDAPHLKVWSMYSVEEMFKMIDAGGARLHGFKLTFPSLRLRNFRTKGVVCVRCGARGSIFSLEGRPGQRPHFNLYAHVGDGQFVQMTKDHIIPKSKGGGETLDNFQPMCKRCNQAKGCQME